MSDNSSSTDSGESFVQTQMGGKKRRNGHKYSCKCPICINMKHAKRGGDNDELTDNLEDETVGSQVAGRKKKGNGHKPSCGCPICKNMRKKGGDIETDEDETEIDSQVAGRKKKGNGHKPSCGCPICKNMRKKGGDEDKKEDDIKGNVTEALDEEYDNLDQDMSFISGGTRKRKTRKSRRNKKTRRNRRHSHRRRR